ncbi:hypothetical protein MMC14_005833 [Varicellaria rhodocarpa]|nr:hypothetical protein [Varicellaria rhodocarpa]
MDVPVAILLSKQSSVDPSPIEKKALPIEDEQYQYVDGREHDMLTNLVPNQPHLPGSLFMTRPPELNSDSEFWWQTTGPILQTLLTQAGYDLYQQCSALSFYRFYVAPYLGPRPDVDGKIQGWKSFMTDDFSPLELSWYWGSPKGTTTPTVRFSIEAIGKSAGTSADPLNQAKTSELVQQLRPCLPLADWSYFDQLRECLCDRDQRSWYMRPKGKADSDQSSMFLAFEYLDTQIVTKAYLIPNLVDDRLHKGVANSPIVHAIKSLYHEHSDIPSLSRLLGFMQNTPQGSSMSLLFLAVDNVPRSRIKIYARSASTSFASIHDTMTINATISGREKALVDLRELWGLVTNLPEDFHDDHELPQIHHPTAGILYHFDVQPGNCFPEPKVYLPVKHYGHDDLHTANALSLFFQRRGADWLAKPFVRALESIASAYRSLEGSRGLQTYIGCAVRKGELVITSYLSPEIYHQGRRRGLKLQSLGARSEQVMETGGERSSCA